MCYGMKVNMKNQKTKTIKLNERQRAFLLHKIVLPVKKKKTRCGANDIRSNTDCVVGSIACHRANRQRKHCRYKVPFQLGPLKWYWNTINGSTIVNFIYLNFSLFAYTESITDLRANECKSIWNVWLAFGRTNHSLETCKYIRNVEPFSSRTSSSSSSCIFTIFELSFHCLLPLAWPLIAARRLPPSYTPHTTPSTMCE